MKQTIKKILSRLSFRTGAIILLLCVPCYIFSFAQMLLPIGAAAKTVLWVIFFGLAKTFQYAGLAVVGTEGVRAISRRFRLLRRGRNRSARGL